MGRGQRCPGCLLALHEQCRLHAGDVITLIGGVVDIAITIAIAIEQHPAAGHDLTGTASARHDRARQGLIELADLPSGWSIDPPNGTDGGLTMSSSKPACADFVAIAGSANAPGSQASAHVDFSGGQNGPFISEGIDALPDRAAVSALQQRIGSANTACSSVTVTMKNAGTSTFTVRPVSAPQFGDHPVAVRITAAGGDLDGLEVTQFSTGVADTVVSLVFDGAYPEEIEQASQTAVEKATQLIGASSDTA
ncbi:MAG: hypothetical protein ABI083_16030 [Lapillicoccus sp.]